MKTMQERFDQAHEDAKQAVDKAIAEVNRTVEGQGISIKFHPQRGKKILKRILTRKRDMSGNMTSRE